MLSVTLTRHLVSTLTPPQRGQRLSRSLKKGIFKRTDIFSAIEMSNLPPDEFLPRGLAKVEWLRNRQNARPDNYFYDSTERRIMYFHTADRAAEIVRDMGDKIGVKHFYPIGNLCCGDRVCVHPTGVLFVVIHDSLEWWDSAVSFEDLLRRLEARDDSLHEDIYTPKENGE